MLVKGAPVRPWRSRSIPMPWLLVSRLLTSPGHQQPCIASLSFTLGWRHNGRDSVSNHQPHDCLLNCLFGRGSKKTSKLRVTGLCVGNSPVTGEYPAQMASDAESVSIWWRHHAWRLIHITCTISQCYYMGIYFHNSYIYIDKNKKYIFRMKCCDCCVRT